ncbi:MAG: competence protein CoiA family protein [Deltaproteobacteria bacterium]|nr:competence protein CoiA family protein [Deltaproteobacteria bacterium]
MRPRDTRLTVGLKESNNRDALRCFDPSANRSVLAFDLSLEEWRALQRENRSARHLRMPCCQAQVVLKKSPRGTAFFAHKSVGSQCSTAPETEAHWYLKRIAVDTARRHGWDAETEIAGTTDTRDQWRADVLARKGKHRVAVEIQWSPQTNEEVSRRQERYVESGVRCLWLFRYGGFPVSRGLPAVRVGGNLDEGLVALVPTGSGKPNLPVEELFDKVFNRHFRFGLPLGCEAIVWVQAGLLRCFSCRVKTRVVTAIVVDVGPFKYRFTIGNLVADLDLFEKVRERIPDGLGIGSIKRRCGKTQTSYYLSNGCANCGARLGDYDHDAWEDEETVCESPTGLRGDRWLHWSNLKTVYSFPIRIDEIWQSAIRQREDYVEKWGIYSMG